MLLGEEYGVQARGRALMGANSFQSLRLQVQVDSTDFNFVSGTFILCCLKQVFFAADSMIRCWIQQTGFVQLSAYQKTSIQNLG